MQTCYFCHYSNDQTIISDCHKKYTIPTFPLQRISSYQINILLSVFYPLLTYLIYRPTFTVSSTSLNASLSSTSQGPTQTLHSAVKTTLDCLSLPAFISSNLSAPFTPSHQQPTQNIPVIPSLCTLASS
jgi:hypothetical protein